MRRLAALGIALLVLAPVPAMARVEPPVNQGAPGEPSQVGVWLWILLVLVVVGLVGVLAWARNLRRRPARVDVYALVGRAIEAGPAG
jgi:hypothetical protein